jgi:hypothetical protein
VGVMRYPDLLATPFPRERILAECADFVVTQSGVLCSRSR